MSLTLLALYSTLAVTLMRALLVKAQRLSPSCGACGLPLERRELGESICSCKSAR
jgi:hypothetical protein